MGRIFFYIAVFLSGTAFGKVSSTRSVIYNVTPLLDVGRSGIALAGSKFLKLKTLGGPGLRVEFEDKFPGANWGHPAIYRVKDSTGKVLEEIPALFPPAELPRAQKLNDLLNPPEGEVSFQIRDLGGVHKVREPNRHFAVLFNGHAEQRHWNDFAFLYRVLITVYGYSKSNIFIADSVHKETRGDLDGDGLPDIKYGSSKGELLALMTELKNTLKKSDHLLLAVNDHGSTNGKESTIVLYDDELTATEFGALLKELPVDKMLALYEQCYSGGFVRSTVTDSRVAMSAATNEELSWASRDGRFDEFLYHVISAFAFQNHEGVFLSADLNTDGRVSAQEAFVHALGKDQAPESPLLEASANTGMAGAIGLNF